MPWRLIFFLLLITIFIFFAGFNTHSVTVNLGPIAISNVPMFIALFIAFLAGALLTLPFSIFSMAKKNKIKAENQKRELTAVLNNEADTLLENDENVKEPDKNRKIKKLTKN